MRLRDMIWVQLAFGAGAAIFLLLAGFSWLSRPSVVPLPVAEKSYALPKHPFAQPEEAYAAIGEPVLTLTYSAPKLQLPDLRQAIVYYGKNGRPDAAGAHRDVHLALAGQPTILSASPGKPFYLQFDRTLSPPRYIASPGNAETSLWIETEPLEKQVTIAVRMRNEKGEVLSSPENLARFTIPEREMARQNTNKWELGKWRVDGSLLARQRARWFGKDVFLERHGGDDFDEIAGKHRVDFGEKDEAYSVYLQAGDCLVWDNNVWKGVVPGKESIGKPLLVVKKIDDRLMNLELWDVEGKSKVALNLIKSNEPWIYQPLQNDFKFVGARTRSQYLFEIKNERVVLSPDDWLVYIDGEWQKLTTIEEIDDYVNRKLVGPLLIFEGMKKEDDHQLMFGTLYNKTRTEAQRLEIAIQPGGGTISSRFVPLETTLAQAFEMEMDREESHVLARSEPSQGQPKEFE